QNGARAVTLGGGQQVRGRPTTADLRAATKPTATAGADARDSGPPRPVVVAGRALGFGLAARLRVALATRTADRAAPAVLAVVGEDDALDQLVAHHVGVREAAKGDALDPAEHPQRVSQAAPAAPREVVLGRVAGDHRPRA